MVSLFATARNKATIFSSAEIATIMDFDFSAIFIEEEQVFDLAEYPFAVVQRMGGSPPTSITPQDMQVAFRRESNACQQSLSELALAAKEPLPFSVRRGSVLGILTAEPQVSCIALPRPSAPGAYRALLDQVRSVQTLTQSVLIGPTEHRKGLAGPVIVVLEEGINHEILVAHAAKVAQNINVPILAITIGNSNNMPTLQSLRSYFGDDLVFDITNIRQSDRELLKRSVAAADASLVIASSSGQFGKNSEKALQLLLATKSALLMIGDESIKSEEDGRPDPV
ncbi:hypothetical protein ACFQ14_00125 [Pseudahrensia aquimaris]|uniref:Uncharacterized protein n=1 Tax=Pseudahrensia aquimaris TaxID=744461 RepID=A0ABW3F8L1_9HYPH